MVCAHCGRVVVCEGSEELIDVVKDMVRDVVVDLTW